ncbi:MAG: AAC(3) family N-acetyltransferase, partial [Candidatus Sumerlaeia bacterium]|nr:AAC(3) family N-acetyltransferase [Candidatus Sumerlaeia bacterium]
MPLDQSKYLDQSTLREELLASGVAKGDLLVVHSSLKAVGRIDGGPTALIQVLEDIIGPTGTLMMPTFTFNLQGWAMGVYDPGRTASRVGMLTEVFRRQPGVCRSLHPTHSVAARGMMAEELTEGAPTLHEPLGPGSPFDRARLLGAKILLLGVGQNRNSTIHLAEHLAELPYLDVPFNEHGDFDAAWYCESTGRPPQLVKIRQMPGSSEGFLLIDHLL